MGTIDVAYNVEATALFFQRPKPDMGKLLTDLNTRLSGVENCHMQMSKLSHEDWWLLSCAEFHIMIAFSDAPCADDAIVQAAKSPVCDLRRFDYPQVVDSHRAHLRIEVGDGSAPLPPEARTIMQEFGAGSICDPVLKMKALHWTLQFIATHQSFLALHFGPSDRLFCPEEIAETCTLDIPTPLLMHPVPTLPEPGPGGVDGYHLHLKNPQYLDGPAISIEGIPVSIPLRTAVTLLKTLLNARAKGRIKLNHGNVIKPSAKLALYARQEDASEQAPAGRIVLSFWKDRGHDIPRAAPISPDTPIVPEIAAKAAAVPVPRIAPLPEPEPEIAAAETPEPAISAIPDTPEHTHVAMHSDPQDLTDILIQRADAKIGAPMMASEQMSPMGAPTPKLRKGPHIWLLHKLRGIPMDTRVKVAGLALLIGMQTFWAPYDGFTGGLSGDTSSQAGLSTGVNAAQLALNFE